MKIALSALIIFLLIGCSDDAPTQNKVVEQKTQVKEQAKVESKAVVKSEEKVEPVKVTVTEAAEEAIEEVKETIKEVATVVKQEAVMAKKDSSALYKSCAACHGADGSKVALGKSAVIKGWSAQKIADALNGYKDGTYGGAMKGLMSGQVKKLSSEDIEVLAEHIAKF